MNQKETFATAFNCIDGRCQDSVTVWAREHFGVYFVDSITEPGMDKLLAEGKNLSLIDWVRAKGEISTEKHNSRKAVVVGHLECAGNPVVRDEHIVHIQTAVKQVESWRLFDDVVGLLVNEDWEIEVISKQKEEAVAA